MCKKIYVEIGISVLLHEPGHFVTCAEGLVPLLAVDGILSSGKSKKKINKKKMRVQQQQKKHYEKKGIIE